MLIGLTVQVDLVGLRSGLQRSLVTFFVTGPLQAHEQPCATTARPLLVAVAQRALAVRLMHSGPCMNMQALPARVTTCESFRIRTVTQAAVSKCLHESTRLNLEELRLLTLPQ